MSGPLAMPIATIFPNPPATVGTNAQILTSQGPGLPAIWSASGGGGFANPMPTLGDLIVGGAAGAPGRLGSGAAHTVLTGNGVGAAPSWQAAAGFANPMTTVGDLIVGGAAGAPGRLGAGAVATALTGTGAGVAPTWQATVGSVTNADASITIAGTAFAVTVAVASVAPSADPAGWNNAVVNGNVAGHSHGSKLDPVAYGLAYGTDPMQTVNTSTTWAASNLALYMRVMGGLAVTNIIFLLDLSSGNYDIGLYTSTGVGIAAVPNNRIASKGSTAQPIAGLITSPVGSVNTVTQGTDWIALAADNTTCEIAGIGSNASVLPGWYASEAAAFPLPTGAGTFGTRSFVPYVFTS